MTVGGAQILARTEALSWTRQAVSAYGSLYRAARDSADRTFRGRGPVPVLTNPEGTGPPWVVRRYFRGGLMRPFGDRFLRVGTPRSFVEVENSARIEDLGFATPRIVAAAVYPGGLLYRADLVTELVPHARTLADVLFGENGPSGGPTGGNARREATVCAAELITRLARAGVHHPDLNAENVLIAREAQRVHAVLLDLDGCRVAGPRVPVDAAKLRRRLARSIRKLERTYPHLENDGERHLTSDEVFRLLGEGKAS
jgi:3-deoxy-D-manno-octulosonic acid kinase